MSSTPLDGVELLLADLDGVVYRGAGAIEFAVESLTRASTGRTLAYLTNNASRTDESVAEHLRELGLRVDPHEVVTSPQAAVRLLADHVPAGSRILVVGGEGLTSEVERAGFTVTRSGLDEPAAVIQGFHPTVGWEHLAEAAFTLNAPGGENVVWVATNTDWTIPQARGIAPGNGTLVSAVHTAVGRLPIVAGKPEVAIFEEAFARFGTRAALMIGDRLDTDILGANRAGIPAALVLTGIDGPRQVLAAGPEERPTYVLGDLRGLQEPYPTVEEKAIRDGVRVRIGRAVVERIGAQVRLVKGSGIDVLRAAAAAVWNSGMAIYALDIEPRLYGE